MNFENFPCRIATANQMKNFDVPKKRVLRTATIFG